LPPALILVIKLGVLVSMPLALMLISVPGLDSMPSVCLIKLATGHECPGCGMTHALVSVFHGHLADAFNYNKLVVVIFPLLSYIWLKNLMIFYKSFRARIR